jgi:hypothetical protein
MSQTIQLEQGDIVRLVTFNPAFHGLLAEVTEVHQWGAMVEVPLFRYGMIPARAPYRASYDEILFVSKAHHVPDPEQPIQLRGTEPISSVVLEATQKLEKATQRLDVLKNGRLIENIAEKRLDAKSQGYSEDPCPKCGSLTLKRNGPCFTCQTCYESTGCS